MSLIVPRFVVVDDKYRERKAVVAAIKERKPDAEIIESSHPFLLKRLIESNRTKGELFAKPLPTVVLSDGNMSMRPDDFTQWEKEHAGLINNSNEEEFDNIAGTVKVLKEHGSRIGDYVCAQVSGGISRASKLRGRPQEIEYLSNPDRVISFPKIGFSGVNVHNLVVYLKKLIALKPSE